MSELINCDRCGKVFRSNNNNTVCPICQELDELDFKKIKEFLYDHPCAKIYEVVNSLNISVRKIKRYLRENRLEILEKNNKFLFCETCGATICSGIYCDTCYYQFHHDYKVIFSGGPNRACSNTINYKSSTGNTKKAALI